MSRLRQLIREFGLDTDMRNMAGTAGGVGANVAHRDRESIMNPPPGLGDEGPDQDMDPDMQLKNQPGARVYDRAGGEARVAVT